MDRAQAVMETSEATVAEAEAATPALTDTHYRVHDEYVAKAYHAGAVRTVVAYWYKLRADDAAPLEFSHFGVL